MLRLLLVVEDLQAAVAAVLAGKADLAGQLLQYQVANVVRPEEHPTAGAGGDHAAAVLADQMAILALKDGREDVLEADRTLEERQQDVIAGEVHLGLGGGNGRLLCHSCGRRRGRGNGGLASSISKLHLRLAAAVPRSREVRLRPAGHLHLRG